MLEETVKSELSAGVLLAANAGKKEKEKKTAGKKGRMQPHDHGHILKEIAAAMEAMLTDSRKKPSEKKLPEKSKEAETPDQEPSANPGQGHITITYGDKEIAAKFHALYQQAEFYTGSTDYAALFSHLGVKLGTQESYAGDYFEQRKDAVSAGDSLGERELFNAQELETYLRRAVVAEMIGTTAEGFNIAEKERFNNYAAFNKEAVMIRYTMLGLGEKAAPMLMGR